MSETPETDQMERVLGLSWFGITAPLDRAQDEAIKYRELARHLERQNAALTYEVQRTRAMFDSAVQTITRITSFIQADDVVLPDGRRFKFHPSDELVREAWGALSKAIRDAALARQGERG